MRFDFSEEEINKMYGMYQNALKEIQEQVERVVEELIEKSRTIQYELVIKVSIASLEYYNETLKKTELQALKDWQEGAVSFSKIMDKLSAGENAVNRGKELETQIEEEIQSWRSLDTSELSGIDTTNMKCETEDFEEIKQIITQFIDGLNEMQNGYSGTLENCKDENGIYIAIEPVIMQSIAIVIQGFGQGINESYLKLAQEFETRSQAVKALGAETTQTIASRSQSFVSDSISELREQMRRILD